MVQRQITWCVTLCHRFKSCWLFFGMLPHKSNACQPGCCVLSDLRAKMPGGYPDTPIFYCPAPSASSDRKEASGVPRFYRQKKAQWYRTYVCICTLSLYAEMRTSYDTASSCDKVSFVDVFSQWFMSRQYKQNERSMTRTEWYHVRSIPL